MNQDESPVEGTLAEQIQRLVQSIAVTERTVLPDTNQVLLQSIVDASARIFGAAAAAIALITKTGRSWNSKLPTMSRKTLASTATSSGTSAIFPAAFWQCR